MYKVFVRSWYKLEAGRLVPHLGRKTMLATVQTEDAARQYCREYNACHNPGVRSRKAEYTSA